jgi:hypothetical protein
MGHPREADTANRPKVRMSLVDSTFTAIDVTAQQLIEIACAACLNRG